MSGRRAKHYVVIGAEGEIMSKVYRVTFYRELVGGNGKRYDSSIREAPIRTTHTQDEAMAAAIKRFERRKRLTHWNHLATKLDISAVA